jgi:carboxyl-terminal processing protease
MRTRVASQILVALLLAAGCGGSSSPAAPAALFNATVYLNAMMDIMESYSINRHTIDWTSFRSTVLAAAAKAQTERDTYPAIGIALGLLGDHHSLYIGATGTQVLSPSLPQCTAPFASHSPFVPATVGYVYVGTCFPCNAYAFAAALQNGIRSADNSNIVGWIVDLRSNGGGDFDPMLVGVGPILGDGIAGYFIDADSRATSWGYSNGARTNGEFTFEPLVTPPYTLIHPNPPVAVLLDSLTASSGEATAVSFLGRPSTRTFGIATCGLSTANSSYGLVGGATLYLTIAIDADRLMRKYGGPITPDESIADPNQVVTRAIEWLQGLTPAQGHLR